MIDLSATALLLMILSDPGAYGRVCMGLLPPSSDQQTQCLMAKSVVDLTHFDARSDPMSRPSCNRFRSRLYKFVNDMKGVVRTF